MISFLKKKNNEIFFFFTYFSIRLTSILFDELCWPRLKLNKFPKCADDEGNTDDDADDVASNGIINLNIINKIYTLSINPKILLQKILSLFYLRQLFFLIEHNRKQKKKKKKESEK